MIHNPCKSWGYFACDIYSFPDTVSQLLLPLLIKQTWNSGVRLRLRLSDMSSYTELPACLTWRDNSSYNHKFAQWFLIDLHNV